MVYHWTTSPHPLFTSEKRKDIFNYEGCLWMPEATDSPWSWRHRRWWATQRGCWEQDDPLQQQCLLLPTCMRRIGDSLSSNPLKCLSRTFFLIVVDKQHHIRVSIWFFFNFILCMCAMAHVWWSQDNLQESDFFPPWVLGTQLKSSTLARVAFTL